MILVQEFQRRLSLVREMMADESLDGLLVYSWRRGHVRYISGYHPNYLANVAAVVIPRQGDPALRIRFPFDLQRARALSWIDDIEASGDVVPLLLDCAAELGKQGADRGRIGLVAADDLMDEMGHSLYEVLRSALPQAKLVPAFHIFQEARLLKSREELSIVRSSAELADLAAEGVRQRLVPGLTEYEVVAQAEATARAHGAEACLAVIASKGGEHPVGPPGDRVVVTGDVVIFELAVQLEGYWTQVASVFSVDTPSSAQQEIYETTWRAYQAGVEAAKFGNTISTMAQAARQVLIDAGLERYLQHDFGHGIGLDLPEPPRIQPENGITIEPGMVLVIHPSVRVPGVGGAFVGGTVLISKDGPEPIHDIPSSLE